MDEQSLTGLFLVYAQGLLWYNNKNTTPTREVSNIVLDAFYSLGRNLNKLSGKDSVETQEGVVSAKFPELKLDMANDKIIDLTRGWNKNWIESGAYSEWKKMSDENENYWKGKHFQRPETDKTRAIVDNVIFEALETYLPQVTRRNPEPLVLLANSEQETPDSLAYVTKLKKELGEIADEVVMRLKLKKTARFWAIHLLGAVKIGWDLDKGIPSPKVIRVAKLILDPDATIDEDGYSGKYVGEHRKNEASILIKILEELDAEEGAIEYIKKKVGDKLGTDFGFIEWWTKEYMCWTVDDQVLLKTKNPHWNYGTDEPVAAGADGIVPTGEDGKPQTQNVPGFNHFTSPDMPYRFLSVFNLGTKPIDDTSLITQNLSNQDVINKRNKQIDKNADSMNGGMIVSGANSGLTKEQSKGVTEALRKGGTIYIPTGTPDEAIKRDSAPSLPENIYQQLIDLRSRTRDIFGTSGITPAGIKGERTVRGKIVTQGLDTDRIGGGFSEYLEQLAGGIYEWTIQMLYVYDPKFKGQHPKVKVSVKDGSLLPKDTTTLANQAMELAAQNRMSLVDLYKALDYPNPEEMAANVWLQENAPQVLLSGDQRVAQAMQNMQQAAAAKGQETEKKPPSQSINFKDLPPEGKAQMAKEVGIDLHPEAIAAHETLKEARGKASISPPVPNLQPSPTA